LQTVEMSDLLAEFGEEYPDAGQVVSVYKDGQIQALDSSDPRKEKNSLVVTFNGLITGSPFVVHIRTLLRTLQERLGAPVKIEFACDGKHIYLLQCSPQIIKRMPRPAPIPKDVARDELVFSANRYVSNGWVSNITHIVYLRPAAYDALEEPGQREAVVEAVAKLNELLPKRQFMLMRPGRWSESGNGRSGVSVRFNEFRNAAVLVDLLPREEVDGEAPSIGIHCLQDLMQSGITYVPVCLDDEATCFNERLLLRAENFLPDLLPEYAFLSDVVHVIDVASATEGKTMQLLMNAELGEAVALLADPEREIGVPVEMDTFEDGQPENYWRWRYSMAEKVASLLDFEKFAVEGVYLFGSAKNGTAGPASDIDILIRFSGTDSQRKDLVHWLEGWSLCLDEVNYLRTGYRSGGLLDFHIITDDDIAKKSSYASKINAVTDAARPLRLKVTDNTPPQVEDERMRESGKGADR
jgi:pyruvate,water dikinase